MTLLQMSTDTQSNLFEVDCGYDDHRSYDAHGGTQTLLAQVAVQSNRPEIVTLG
jgi:hypothetical protein